MPIYEFQCRECHNTLELLQKVNDPVPEVCPSCGKQGSLGKLVSHTSFQLKGGGWYSDLYASTKPEAGTSSKGGDGKSASAATTTTPTAAPAAPPAAAPTATKSDT